MQTVAAQITEAVPAIVRDRLERHDTDVRFGDWTCYESAMNYRSVLTSVAAWTNGEACVMVTANGRTGAGEAASVLDRAAADHELPDTAEIIEVSAHTVKLVW